MTQPLKSSTLLARGDSLAPPPPYALKKQEELWIAVHWPELAPSAERSQLQALAARALEFTPKVCVQAPQELLLEVAGSRRLFGGFAAIKEALLRSFHGSRPFSTAAAPTGLAALWLARARGKDILQPEELMGQLGCLDLSVTQWSEKTQRLLGEMGVRTIADCLRLPRDGFSLRVGRQYLLDLDKASGKACDPRLEFKMAPRLSYRIELQHEMTSSDQLTHCSCELIERLVRDLQLRQAQIRDFEVVLEPVRGTPDRLRIELVEPAHDSRRFLRLVADKCERMVLTAPVIAMSLNTGVLQSLADQRDQPLIFATASQETHEHGATSSVAPAELIELLRGRLGAQRVYSMKLLSDHRPEVAWEKHFDYRADPAETAVCPPRGAERPLWLLRTPRRLPGRSAPFHEGPLKLLSGPERIETGWWDRDVTRDYYCALTVHGTKLWIYQERAQRDWYLHGVFG
jgi:protein ImuB